ncbi:MAG: carboxypeptidase regulatory-like domain-containing protein [Candidatus Acidiferrales bacterium]
MIRARVTVTIWLALIGFLALGATAFGQSNSASVQGVVTDPSGALVPGAKVEMRNPVSGFDSTAITDINGAFAFSNVAFNPYHLTVEAKGFNASVQDIDVRSSVPINLKISLEVATATATVTVQAEAGDLLENDPTAHTDVDRKLFDKLPLESASSSVSSLVTLASPGVAADSNGLFHGLGDHAENSFSVDGQPITDQQSKIFSNQIPLSSIQSLEVIQGAPPAEYGDKTSLVINVTTRSGIGQTTPHGSVRLSYGTFGTSSAGFDLGYGGQKWGNFISVDGLNTGRFLDPPEFTVMHDKGNEENVFDRVDFQLSQADTVHLNFGYSRSWFQNPNSFDQQLHPGLVNNVTGGLLGLTDQRSLIKTFNIAPTWTRIINSYTVFNFGGFVRQDQYNYIPSGNPLNDLSPDLQSETVAQARKLTNAGLRSDLSYVKGINNVKAGIVYEQTFLTENDRIGIVDPTLNPVCFNFDGSPNTNPALTNPSQCGGLQNPGGTVNAGFKPFLACLDLTRPVPDPSDPCSNSPNKSIPFFFPGHTDVKELALYVQDSITKGRWAFNVGVRGDLYNGLAKASQAEPRLGIAYNIKPTNTILRISYARSLETPFNENLVIGSTGCQFQVLATIVPPPGVMCNLAAIQPGWRNEFHAGLQQAFGRYLVIDGEYIWKYTHNGYDFGIVGATPITFPIEWHNSKIPGYTVRASVPNIHGFSALVVMSGVSARFFLPQVAGLPIIPVGNSVFRIDHDEHFNETTHLQYQPWKRGPWVGFNWRYDSGLVSGSVPCSAPTATCFASTPIADGGGANIPSGQVALVNAITGLPLTADQEFQAGLTCNGKLAAPSPTGPALATCSAGGLGSLFLQVPAPGKENDDHNPQRIAPRNLFDMAVGVDNLFHGDRYTWSVRVTAVNITNKVALYNFLSTFSGTHYVTPRALTAEVGFHF